MKRMLENTSNDGFYAGCNYTFGVKTHNFKFWKHLKIVLHKNQ